MKAQMITLLLSAAFSLSGCLPMMLPMMGMMGSQHGTQDASHQNKSGAESASNRSAPQEEEAQHQQKK
ncbi:MAG: hypothetical protein H7833_13995 [Magnetococcus sp. DMHC-1]|nr:hypothetical protein [Magnetococcales bacterium]